MSLLHMNPLHMNPRPIAGHGNRNVLLRLLGTLSLLAGLSLLGACNKAEEAAPVATAPQVLVAPTGIDDGAWKTYLQQVVMQNMSNISNSPYMYYLPAPSTAEYESMYARQLENVATTIERTVLPGNMLAFGSPDSARIADLVVESFKSASPDSMKGVRVLFVGAAADRERVEVAVAPSAADFVFIEAK